MQNLGATRPSPISHFPYPIRVEDGVEASTGVTVGSLLHRGDSVLRLVHARRDELAEM